MAETGDTTEKLIAPRRMQRLTSAIWKLVGVNVACAGISLYNEVAIGHQALGINQFLMESADAAIVTTLLATSAMDARGEHDKARRTRIGLYAGHIGVAAYGSFEAVRLIGQDVAPTPANIALSGAVAVISGGYFRHLWRHFSRKAHHEATSLAMATRDPIEIVEDSLAQDTAGAVFVDNEAGVSSVGATNAVESAGGLAGTVGQAIFDQSGALGAITGNGAVMGIMAWEIMKNMQNGKKNNHTLVPEPICIQQPIIQN